MQEIDVLANRYKKLPSDFLDMDIDKFSFNNLVAQVGFQEELKQQKKIQQQSRTRLR